MPRLRQHERKQAVGMLLAGMAQTQIASHFNVSRMTIYRLMIRLRDTGNTSDRPRSGRPRVATLRQDRHIRFIHLRIRFVFQPVTFQQPVSFHVDVAGALTSVASMISLDATFCLQLRMTHLITFVSIRTHR
jgi:hypothetical protein